MEGRAVEGMGLRADRAVGGVGGWVVTGAYVQLDCCCNFSV